MVFDLNNLDLNEGKKHLRKSILFVSSTPANQYSLFGAKVTTTTALLWFVVNWIKINISSQLRYLQHNNWSKSDAIMQLETQICIQHYYC